MNRTSVGALTAAAAVAASLLVASPAHAATLDIGDSCTEAGDSFFAVTAAPGETITVVHSTNCVPDTGIVPLLSTPVTKVDDYEYVIDPTAQPGPIPNAIVILKDVSGDFLSSNYVVINLTITPGSGGGPPDIVQQVGRPAAGCADLNVPTADWSGVGAGGWSPSWAWWMNDGQGGPVCTRTLGYSTTSGGWFVRS